MAGGYVVTSGTFTKDAKQFASGRNIELIDGKGLDGLLRDGQSAAPTCPKCKSPMVMRTAKKGAMWVGRFGAVRSTRSVVIR